MNPIAKARSPIRCEARGADRCRVTFDATVAIEVIGVGGLLESTGEKSTRRSWTNFMAGFGKSLQR